MRADTNVKSRVKLVPCAMQVTVPGVLSNHPDTNTSSKLSATLESDNTIVEGSRI